MNHLILGVGEIGRAYYEILSPHFNVYRLDIRPEVSDAIDLIPKDIGVMHICLRYSDEFEATISREAYNYAPKLINNMTTCPPGTTEKFGACHSTTRGLHPNLAGWIRNGVKHIGGPRAQELAEMFAQVGIKTKTHALARTTELAHIMSNALYGVQVMFADEMDKLCREFGVDYFEAVQLYSMTHNEGYAAAGMVSKFRPILTPTNGKIGGHCVTQGAALIPEEKRGELLQKLAEFNTL